ncbi:hypothetical protein PMG71_15775 [Roseofilum sp. BLCC_M154]|uniref:Uncharacterized protein n=1 Tax=Roseofilum acuticapitatum BLCC-M154 TaxID=3022444 RepID=A0ABT7AVF1_9CYAN|nr:hypothetical protein [Roseofilum acuticapitatum]MDJ1170892.1 hypothetical protein [Roseofilum acuticapitatum BLCC-M154]
MTTSSTVALATQNKSVSTSIQAKESWKKMQNLYQADQQVKYLHLEAEVECLLQQIQLMARK